MPQPIVQYAAPQPTIMMPQTQAIQYVNELGQPCTADGQLLGGEVQYVNELGQPCTADGQLLMPQVQYASPMLQYGAPAPPQTFNITPEQFAILSQGGQI